MRTHSATHSPFFRENFSTKFMQLHLFSSPGEPFLADILAVTRQVLAGLVDPLVAYLPVAAEDRHFVRETKAAFRGLAEVRAIKPEIHSPASMRSVLIRAGLVYIPGGNTYLAALRLRRSGLTDELRQRIRAGLPLVGFSAGTVLCGADILTTNDANLCGCADFSGLGLVPYNFNVHYPSLEGEERRARDARLQAYAADHQRAVLALEDGAYVRVVNEHIEVVTGPVWKIDGKDKERFL
jgi:dipeptidase E